MVRAQESEPAYEFPSYSSSFPVLNTIPLFHIPFFRPTIITTLLTIMTSVLKQDPFLSILLGNETSLPTGQQCKQTTPTERQALLNALPHIATAVTTTLTKLGYNPHTEADARWKVSILNYFRAVYKIVEPYFGKNIPSQTYDVGNANGAALAMTNQQIVNLVSGATHALCVFVRRESRRYGIWVAL